MSGLTQVAKGVSAAHERAKEKSSNNNSQQGGGGDGLENDDTKEKDQAIEERIEEHLENKEYEDVLVVDDETVLGFVPFTTKIEARSDETECTSEGATHGSHAAK